MQLDTGRLDTPPLLVAMFERAPHGIALADLSGRYVRANPAFLRLLGYSEHELLQLCRQGLPRHKVPAAINFVPALAVAATGKIVRHHA